MAHLKKSASTGRLLKTSTGHLSKGCGAACCGDGLTSKSVSISGSGIASSCVASSGPSGYQSFSLKSTFSLDGTYTANWSGIGCIFTANTAAIGSFPSDRAWAWADSACSSGAANMDSDVIEIEVNIGTSCEYIVTITFLSGPMANDTLFQGSSSAGDAPGPATFSIPGICVSGSASITIS